MGTTDIDNRFRHHPPRDTGVVAAHEAAREGCRRLARWLDEELPDGREKALAITNLEQVMFWANAAIAREGD